MTEYKCQCILGYCNNILLIKFPKKILRLSSDLGPLLFFCY